MALYGDPDLEHGLREDGVEPDETTYRLIEIPLAAVTDTASMPWPHIGTAYVDAVEAGQEFSPAVVRRNARGWGLIDGCNRTHAYWMTALSRVDGQVAGACEVRRRWREPRPHALAVMPARAVDARRPGSPASCASADKLGQGPGIRQSPPVIGAAHYVLGE